MPANSYQHPSVTSAVQLILSGRTAINVLIEFCGNENIHLRNCVGGNELAEQFVNSCKNLGINVGKYYSVGLEDEMRVEHFLDAFMEIPGTERGEIDEIRNTAFPECVIIAIRENAELNIYWEKTSAEDRKFCEQPYIGKIKIQPRGYAVNL